MTKEELNQIEKTLKELSRNMEEKYATNKLDYFDIGYSWAINDVWEALNKSFSYGNYDRTISDKESKPNY